MTSRCAARATLLADPLHKVAAFLRSSAGVEPPEDLPALIQLLTARGEEPVEPSDRQNLHPLVIPLTRSSEGDYTCLLRWPTPQEDAPLPVVRTRSGLFGLQLVAMSTLELAHRMAAEEDARQGKEAEWTASLVNQYLPQDKQYERGAVDKVGYGVERYLFLRVGSFPDIYDYLTQFHIQKGDEQSALVTAEKANTVFKGWGQPYMAHCKLLRGLQAREYEARDAARVALRTPLWTIAMYQEDLDMILECAKSDRARAQQKFWNLYTDERLHEIKQGKRPEQVAVDRAAYLMDAAVLGAEGVQSWGEVRGQLADLYEEGGLGEVAQLVRG